MTEYNENSFSKKFFFFLLFLISSTSLQFCPFVFVEVSRITLISFELIFNVENIFKYISDQFKRKKKNDFRGWLSSYVRFYWWGDIEGWILGVGWWDVKGDSTKPRSMTDKLLIFTRGRHYSRKRKVHIWLLFVSSLGLFTLLVTPLSIDSSLSFDFLYFLFLSSLTILQYIIYVLIKRRIAIIYYQILF